MRRVGVIAVVLAALLVTGSAQAHRVLLRGESGNWSTPANTAVKVFLYRDGEQLHYKQQSGCLAVASGPHVLAVLNNCGLNKPFRVRWEQRGDSPLLLIFRKR